MPPTSSLPPHHLEAVWAIVRACDRGDFTLHRARGDVVRLAARFPADDGALLVDVLDEIAWSTGSDVTDVAERRVDALVELVRRASEALGAAPEAQGGPLPAKDAKPRSRRARPRRGHRRRMR